MDGIGSGAVAPGAGGTPLRPQPRLAASSATNTAASETPRRRSRTPRVPGGEGLLPELREAENGANALTAWTRNETPALGLRRPFGLLTMGAGRHACPRTASSRQCRTRRASQPRKPRWACGPTTSIRAHFRRGRRRPLGSRPEETTPPARWLRTDHARGAGGYRHTWPTRRRCSGSIRSRTRCLGSCRTVRCPTDAGA